MEKYNLRNAVLTPKTIRFYIGIIAALFLSTPLLLAAGEIQIESISMEEKSVHHYVLTGQVINSSASPRDVILRAQVSFYDRAAPKGDLPVMVLRKDMNIVLRAGESRKVEATFLNEGDAPRGAVRAEPALRIRRQRPWSY